MGLCDILLFLTHVVHFDPLNMEGLLTANSNCGTSQLRVLILHLILFPSVIVILCISDPQKDDLIAFGDVELDAFPVVSSFAHTLKYLYNSYDLDPFGDSVELGTQRLIECYFSSPVTLGNNDQSESNQLGILHRILPGVLVQVL